MSDLNPPVSKINEEFIIVPSLDRKQLIHTEPLVVKTEGKEIYDGMMVVTIFPIQFSKINKTINLKKASVEVTSYTSNVKIDIESASFKKSSDDKNDYILDLKLNGEEGNGKSVVSMEIDMDDNVECKHLGQCDVHVTLAEKHRPRSRTAEIMSQDQICKFRWVLRN